MKINKCLLCRRSKVDEKCNESECNPTPLSTRGLNDKRIVYKVKLDYLTESLQKDKLGKPKNYKDIMLINKQISESIYIINKLEKTIIDREIENHEQRRKKRIV